MQEFTEANLLLLRQRVTKHREPRVLLVLRGNIQAGWRQCLTSCASQNLQPFSRIFKPLEKGSVVVVYDASDPLLSDVRHANDML